MLVLTMLLMAWLSLTCQNCFANTEDASLMHANMECCLEGGHSDHGHTEFDHKSCGSNYLMSQPVVATVADNTVIQSGDQTIVLLPVTLHDSSSLPPDRYQHAGLNQDVYFSPRLFSSYRILLI
jgi:hypothetical protein